MRTFWDKQPVPQEGAVYESGKEIEKEKNIVNEPIKLPDGFSWDKPKLEEAHKLLNPLKPSNGQLNCVDTKIEVSATMIRVNSLDTFQVFQQK